MNVLIKLDKEYNSKDVLDTINSIFTEKASFVEYKVKRYQEDCESFEKKYSLISDDFLKKFEAGQLGDDKHYFDWFAAKRGLDLWSNKLAILRGAKISEN